MTTRRAFLAAAGAAGAAAGRGPKTILLRSGWQTVNIGDITHTPGVLACLERVMPDTRVILWPGDIDRGVEPMLKRRFPKLRIAKGGIGKDGEPATEDLQDAFREASLYLHGSGPSLTAPEQTDCWVRSTGKPYGFYGIGVTIGGEAAGNKLDDRIRRLMTGSKFLFTRETASLRNLEKAGIQGPKTGFAPDGTFSFDIRDDAKGDAFLREHGLEPGKFIAMIPRLRVTPYHLIRKNHNYSKEEIARRTELNERHAEKDHAKFREVATAWVNKTGGKVLFCPEMTYELDIIDPLLYNPLAPEVKAKAVPRRTYWLPDEAASVYRKAAAVISMECHSPIIAAAVGTPCMYVHQPEDGIKGQMYPDLGLGAWYFQVEETTGAQLAGAVLEIAARPEAAKKKVREAAALAQSKQDEATRVVKAVLG